MYLVFKDEKKAQEALVQINANMGFPDGKGTETWAVVQKAHEQDLWFLVAPRSEYLTGVFWDNVEDDVSNYIPKLSLIEHEKQKQK